MDQWFEREMAEGRLDIDWDLVGITPSEAYQRYRGGYYQRMNEALRGVLPEGDRQRELTLRMLEQMNAFYSRGSFPAPDDLTVLRGVSGWDPSTVYRPGEFVVEQGYMSTTTDLGTAMSFSEGDGWTMEVRVPRGTPVILGTDQESEVILNRGTISRVVSVDRESRHVVLEVEE